MAYEPKTYRDQGGDRIVISTAGGSVRIGSNALITTGAVVDLSSSRNWIKDDVYSTGTVYGNALSSTGTGGYKPFIETVTSSAATLVAYGISYVKASTTLTMPLAAPSASVEKRIIIVSTGATVTITSSSAGADFTTGGSTQISITTGTITAPSWVHLLGSNSTRWTVLGQSANVTIS